MNRRTTIATRTASVAAATLTAWLIGTGTATPQMQWEGQFNPSALLDTSQVSHGATCDTVETPDGPQCVLDLPVPDTAAPTDVDCWDAWSCKRTENGLDPAYDTVTYHDGPIPVETGALHDGCLIAVGDTSLIVCSAGWATTS